MEHSDIEHMAQGYPPAHIAKDSEEVIVWLATQLLATQEERDALAAENAALKAAISYVCDTGNQPDFSHEGVGCGLEDQGITDRYEAASYGWDEAMDRMYSEVIPCTSDIATPATDAYINAVRAEGIHFAANRMLAAWESGFIDGTPAKVHDISGAVLSALEFLPSASPEEFKRDYADEVRSAIANQLRAGKDSE